MTQQTQKEKLAGGYLPAFRVVEILSTVSFIGAAIYIAWNWSGFAAETPWVAVAAFLAGWIAADFVSGFVHWAGDTWGTTDWFLIGQTLIRTFREHHVDQKAITRHDFIETNGTNCLISLPILFWCVVAAPSFVSITLFSMVLWVFATNQIHKWAHLDERPGWISFLQRTRLILSPENHDVHHHAPFAKYYCITTGWLNGPLFAIGFFPRAERLITWLTGALPREHDLHVVETAVTEAEAGV